MEQLTKKSMTLVKGGTYKGEVQDLGGVVKVGTPTGGGN